MPVLWLGKESVAFICRKECIGLWWRLLASFSHIRPLRAVGCNSWHSAISCVPAQPDSERSRACFSRADFPSSTLSECRWTLASIPMTGRTSQSWFCPFWDCTCPRCSRTWSYRETAARVSPCRWRISPPWRCLPSASTPVCASRSVAPATRSSRRWETFPRVPCSMRCACSICPFKEYTLSHSLQDWGKCGRNGSRQKPVRSLSGTLLGPANRTECRAVIARWICSRGFSSSRLLGAKWSCSSYSRCALWCLWCTCGFLHRSIILPLTTSQKCSFARFLCSLPLSDDIKAAYLSWRRSPSMNVFW